MVSGGIRVKVKVLSPWGDKYSQSNVSACVLTSGVDVTLVSEKRKSGNNDSLCLNRLRVLIYLALFMLAALLLENKCLHADFLHLPIWQTFVSYMFFLLFSVSTITTSKSFSACI